MILSRQHKPVRSGKSNSSNNNSGHGKPSRLKSVGWIAFWSLYAIAQCLLLRMYHKAALGSSDGSHARGNTLGFYLPPQLSSFKEGTGGTIRNLDGNRNPPTHHATTNNRTAPSTSTSTSPSPPDGTFNGYPIYQLDATHNLEDLYSQFHCVGETWHDAELHRRSRTFHEQSWMYRSCRFQVFCYDTETQEYVVYLDPEKHPESHGDHHYHHANDAGGSGGKAHPSPQVQQILDAQQKQLAKEAREVADATHERNATTDFKHPTWIDDTSTVYRNHTIVINSNGKVVIGDTVGGKQYGVSIGSVNGKWGLVDIQLLKWFPEVRWGPIPGTHTGTQDSHQKKYEVYMLPSSVIMIPFHSLSAENPGHLVWDDFLPMFTLLDMFGFLHRHTSRTGSRNDHHGHSTEEWMDLLPIRYQLPTVQRGLWASCDWLDSKKEGCHKMLSKFGILLGTRRSYRKFHASQEAYNATVSASKLPRIPITTNRHVQLKLASQGESLGLDAVEDHTDTFMTKRRGWGRRRLGQKEHDKEQDGGDHDDNNNNNSTATPKLICAKNGMAGFGALSDHRPNMGHGWESHDYETNYNAGRGGQLWEFRNFMIHNLFEPLPKRTTNQTSTRRRLLGATKKPSVTLRPQDVNSYPLSSITDLGPDEPLVVMISTFSSQRRGGDFSKQAKSLTNAIEAAGGSYSFLYGKEAAPGAIGANVQIVVESHTFAKYTLEEQVQMASRTAVFVTYCGGGAITASFLPRGGGLHVYYGETSGIESNRPTGKPARLDWDFFNNCGYIHVQWLPYSRTMSRGWDKGHVDGGGYENQLDANTDLMKAELRRIHGERVKHYQKQQTAESKP